MTSAGFTIQPHLYFIEVLDMEIPKQQIACFLTSVQTDFMLENDFIVII